MASLGWTPWTDLLHARGLDSPRNSTADFIVVGGGFGGVAAALAACRAGLNVVLTEETDWIGGQVSSQAVPPDEHPWIESHGCTRSYRAFRDGVRAYYRDHFPLTTAARENPQLNPVEWNIGEAVGALVGFCRYRHIVPRMVRNEARHLANFQQRLRSQGFELEWPQTRPL